MNASLPPLPAGFASPPPPAEPPGLRPLSVGEVLDRSVKLYMANFGTLAKIVLVIVVPVQLISLAVTISTFPGGALPGATRGSLGGSPSPAYTGGQVVVSVLGIITALLVTAACFKAVADAYLGERPQWRSSLGFALGRARSLLWLWVLYFVAVFIGTILLIVPGVYVFIACVVSTPVLLLEGHRGFKALRRSQALVRGRWWPTFGTFLVAIVLLFVVSAFVGLIIGVVFGLSFALGGRGGSFVLLFVISAVGGTVAEVVTRPFLAAVVTLMYFDLRVRKEGLDLQLMAGRIGAPAPRAPEALAAPAGAEAPAAPVDPSLPERPSGPDPFGR